MEAPIAQNPTQNYTIASFSLLNVCICTNSKYSASGQFYSPDRWRNSNGRKRNGTRRRRKQLSPGQYRINRPTTWGKVRPLVSHCTRTIARLFECNGSKKSTV